MLHQIPQTQTVKTTPCAICRESEGPAQRSANSKRCRWRIKGTLHADASTARGHRPLLERIPRLLKGKSHAPGQK